MRHNEKSENIAQGRRSLVIASQAVGVVAVYRRHRRPNPFVSGQSFHFQMTVALGEILLGPLTLTIRVKRLKKKKENKKEKSLTPSVKGDRRNAV